MKYHLDLFTPETWEAFRKAGATVTGFRERHRRLAEERVSQGDFLLCYLTRLSRWCGVLEVISGSFFDDSPIFKDPDPFTVRFKVKPVAVLDQEWAVPIREQQVWRALTITNPYDMRQSRWTGFFRGSLNTFKDGDGSFLTKLLKEQQAKLTKYPLTDTDKRQLARKRRVRAIDKGVENEVPLYDDEPPSPESEMGAAAEGLEGRESIRYQARVAQIGAEMGFRVWVPRGDRARVLEFIPATMHGRFLDSLPLNYDDTTLRTVEQIDVLWLKGQSMARAFEIEHTTAIYSGLLRMADLLTLQPNMNIRLHIVAPSDKRNRVLREITRPVFSQLARGPLYNQCSFLPYEAIDSLAQTQYLSYMSDTVIERYEEAAKV